MKKEFVLVLGMFLVLLLGCATTGPINESDVVEKQIEEMVTEDVEEVVEPEPEPEPELEVIPEPKPKPAPKPYVAPVDLSEEKDTCGCSFRWDPVCGKDGKTYVNRCLYECFGFDEDDIAVNSMCPKKSGPIKIYTDDLEFDYDTHHWNGANCWRQMYRNSGVRYCENLVVNGRIMSEPEPLKGNWLSKEYIVEEGADDYKIVVKTGDKVTNEEYNISFQPLFEEGKYVFSFWARQDIASNNDWSVTLNLKDWWGEEPMPPGVEGCYAVETKIRGEDHFFEERPNEWRHYHYEFDVPLKLEQWDSKMRKSHLCEYDWDKVPHGYSISVEGPSVGEAHFDDFSIFED